MGEDGPVPTPYQRPVAQLAGGVGAGRTPRPPLVRPLGGRWLGGVCVGVADHLGVDVRGIRFALAVLTVLGPGLPAYLFLWALVPSAALPAPTPGDPRERVTDPAPLERALEGVRRSRAGALVAVGGVVVVVGLLIALNAVGLDVRAGVLVPLLVIAAGALVVWSDLDASGRRKALGESGGSAGWVWLRVGLGLVLAVVGLLLLVVRGASLTAAFDAILAAVAVLAGVGLILAPWILRLWTNARRESEEAARARERADIAAHLHDSVLQTLALIQRRSHDPSAVALLARAQERDLRQWLYGPPTQGPEMLAAALTAVASEVEDMHGQPVELVVAGDRPLEPHGRALAEALREALRNAVRHGRPPVSAYVEIGPDGVEAFVRDRGDGFDLAEVPPDRLGVRHSIIERMERHGGSARLRRLEEGTEVSLMLPALEGEGDE